MVDCKDCGKEFSDSDTVHECESCEEPFCDSCGEEHSCGETGEHQNESCEDCGELEESMKICDTCENYYCNKCIDEHIKSEVHLTSYSYEDYVKEKTLKEL